MDDFDKSNDRSGNDGGGPDSLPVQAPAPGRALTVDRRSQELALDLRPQLGDEEREEDGLDLRRVWALILKRRWTVLAVLVIIVAATTTATMLTVPLYRATASIQIEREAIKVVNVEGVLPTEYADASFFETQFELLRSRNLALRVVKELNLREHPVANQMMQPTGWSAFKVWVGSIVNPQAPPAPNEKKAPAPIFDPNLPYAGVVMAHLSIEPVAKSRMVRVSFHSPDPRFSQLVANGVADAFITMTLERRMDASSFAGEFLEERLAQLRLKLEDSERALIEYAKKEEIVGPISGEKAGLIEQNLNETNSALSAAERERINMEANFEQMRRIGPGSLPQVLENTLIQSLKEQRAKLQAEYSEKLATFKPAFPAMLQLKNQIAEVDRQIAAEVAAARGQVESQYGAALARERLLRARLDELKQEMTAKQTRSVQYGILKREVDTNREIYDGLLQRYKEVGLAGGVGTNNVSVVDRAEPGYKFKPSLSTNLSMALFLGLFAGILLAMLLEYLDDSVKSPDDVEKHLKLPILGLIPKLAEKTTPANALAEVRSAFAEAYRSVRTALQFSTSDGVPKILFITSPAATEGKSTTAFALANNFAQLGKRVLLVDCD
ncbi:MAG TPA: exopolysaccharide transport family protein, partial [Xanthomonadales bacterium]|nr:exopolysaccharide transport family protein [Xanthomonadales bacterium]